MLGQQDRKAREMFMTKAKALENENRALIRQVEQQKREIDELKKQLMGERVVTPYCQGCTNFIEDATDYWFAGCCALDHKCKDFARKER